MTAIHSPIDGVVISRSVDVGQTVAASLQAPTIFTLAEDLRKMQVEAHVSEADVAKLTAGMPVNFTVDAFPGRSFAGTLRQVRNAAETVQNVVTYDAIVDVDNPDLELRPGMTANVTFVVAEQERRPAHPQRRPPLPARRRDRPRPPSRPARGGPHRVRPARAPPCSPGGCGWASPTAATPSWSRGTCAEGLTLVTDMGGTTPAAGSRGNGGERPGMGAGGPPGLSPGALPGWAAAAAGAAAEARPSAAASTRTQETTVMKPALIELRTSASSTGWDDSTVQRPRRREPAHRRRRVRRHHGPVGLGQVDPHEHHRLPRRPQRRQLPAGRARGGAA